MQRFKKLNPEEMSAEQRKVYDAIAGGPRGGVRGPFNALLRSPELAQYAQKLGEYIRFSSSIPAALNELAILITGRYWTAQYEWYAHRKLGLKAGLPEKLIDEIGEGKRPSAMSADEKIVYDFCTELHRDKGVSDAAYKAVVDRFGERGAVDLIGASGYYTLVSMTLNVERTPLPEDAVPLKPLK